MADFKEMCPHSEFCGGCIYQGTSYEAQLAEKEQSVLKLLEDKNLQYTGYENERKRFFRNQEQARIICLTALTISTLVINQESIYNKFYDGHGPQQYRITALTKSYLIYSKRC